MSMNIKAAIIPQYIQNIKIIDRIDQLNIPDPAIFSFQFLPVCTLIPVTDKNQHITAFRKSFQSNMAIVFRLDTAHRERILFSFQPIKVQYRTLSLLSDRPFHMIPSVSDQCRIFSVDIKNIILNTFIIRNDHIRKTNSHSLGKSQKPTGKSSPFRPSVL